MAQSSASVHPAATTAITIIPDGDSRTQSARASSCSKRAGNLSTGVIGIVAVVVGALIAERFVYCVLQSEGSVDWEPSRMTLFMSNATRVNCMVLLTLWVTIAWAQQLKRKDVGMRALLWYFVTVVPYSAAWASLHRKAPYVMISTMAWLYAMRVTHTIVAWKWSIYTDAIASSGTIVVIGAVVISLCITGKYDMIWLCFRMFSASAMLVDTAVRGSILVQLKASAIILMAYIACSFACVCLLPFAPYPTSWQAHHAIVAYACTLAIAVPY
jgi:hypothetical protein